MIYLKLVSCLYGLCVQLYIDLSCSYEWTLPELFALRFAVLGAGLAVLAVRDEEYMQRILDVVGHASVEMSIHIVALCLHGRPSKHLARDPPHVHVHRELGAAHAEQQHARDSLLAHPFELPH